MFDCFTRKKDKASDNVAFQSDLKIEKEEIGIPFQKKITNIRGVHYYDSQTNQLNRSLGREKTNNKKDILKPSKKTPFEQNFPQNGLIDQKNVTYKQLQTNKNNYYDAKQINQSKQKLNQINNNKQEVQLPAIFAESNLLRPKQPFQKLEANQNIELTNLNNQFSKVQAPEQNINSQQGFFDETDEIGIITTKNENGINNIKKKNFVEKSNKYNQYQIEEAKQSQKQGRRITGQQQRNSSKIIAINQKPKFKFIVLTCAIENNFYRSDIFYYSDPYEQGKLYRTEYDLLNYNPMYTITEGYYNMGDPHSIKIIDKRVEYLGKSNNIKLVQQKEQMPKNTHDEPNVSKKIKIFDQEGTLLNNGSQKRFVQIQTWIKFNQQISQRDITILKPSSRDWLTSSIIDSYALYLNLENSQTYFSKPASLQQSIKRLFIVESSIYTSFYFKNQFEYQEQHQEVFKKEFLEFQEIKYQVWDIYQQMAFIINRNNTHWFLILINFETLEIEFYDSLFPTSEQYKYCKYFSTFFTKLGFSGNFQSSVIRNQDFTQSDGYSCGHRTCSFMKYLSDKQFNENVIYRYDEREIKRKLTQLLSE